jgi:hypothetical protein
MTYSDPPVRRQPADARMETTITMMAMRRLQIMGFSATTSWAMAREGDVNSSRRAC